MRTIKSQKIQAHYNVALITSQFNPDVTQRLHQGALDRLREHAFADEHITTVWVPGAVEIPIVAQRLARGDQYEVIICLGAVIRGQTSHYDYVCEQVSWGCQKVALDNSIPVIFGVLTTDTEEQALARAGGDHGNKGRDAVDAALDMVSVLRQIDA